MGIHRDALMVAGSLAQRPLHGGHAWVLLNLLRGLERLGWEVAFVDRLEPSMWVNPSGTATTETPAFNVAYFDRVMRGFEVPRYCLLDGNNGFLAGMDREELLRFAKRSAALINVMGFLGEQEVLERVGRRVFFDIDPGFWQMWRENGHGIRFEDHDMFVTIGENIGESGCPIPTCGLSWITTPQPVVLEEWEPAPNCGDSFTSVISWRGPFGPIEHSGRTYGLRVHEFRKFLELPRRTNERFELALDIDPADERDRAALESNGWALADPVKMAGDPWSYRDYIRRSKAEFMVAKNIYVDTRSGWFSDRSICYLASGKAVLAQDTGLGDRYPIGDGLLLYSTLDEAAAGVEKIAGDHERHSRAARAIAEEFFDSDKVLKRLLDRLEIEAP
ncbi:MAG: glycosyltransferase [Gammaproteobacteria bacterium]